MDEQRAGGPAFPNIKSDPWGKAYKIAGGVTVRDYFAAKAMQSLITTVALERHSINPGLNIPDGIALDAYALADAMLKAREE